MNYVNENSIIGEFIELYPETVDVLINSGMHCLGCSASSGESLKDACLIHELDVASIVNLLNQKINEVRGNE